MNQAIARGRPACDYIRGWLHWSLGAYARLLAHGAAEVWDPRDAPEPGMRMAYVTDPDGNLIELVAPISRRS